MRQNLDIFTKQLRLELGQAKPESRPGIIQRYFMETRKLRQPGEGIRLLTAMLHVVPQAELLDIAVHFATSNNVPECLHELLQAVNAMPDSVVKNHLLRRFSLDAFEHGAQAFTLSWAVEHGSETLIQEILEAPGRITDLRIRGDIANVHFQMLLDSPKFLRKLLSLGFAEQLMAWLADGARAHEKVEHCFNVLCASAVQLDSAQRRNKIIQALLQLPVKPGGTSFWLHYALQSNNNRLTWRVIAAVNLLNDETLQQQILQSMFQSVVDSDGPDTAIPKFQQLLAGFVQVDDQCLREDEIHLLEMELGYLLMTTRDRFQAPVSVFWALAENSPERITLLLNYLSSASLEDRLRILQGLHDYAGDVRIVPILCDWAESNEDEAILAELLQLTLAQDAEAFDAATEMTSWAGEHTLALLGELQDSKASVEFAIEHILDAADDLSEQAVELTMGCWSVVADSGIRAPLMQHVLTYVEHNEFPAGLKLDTEIVLRYARERIGGIEELTTMAAKLNLQQVQNCLQELGVAVPKPAKHARCAI